MTAERQGRLARDGVELAWSLLPGRGPTIVFLPGFKSDMAGSKALHLRDWAAGQGRAMLRLDYSGHGDSGGAFADGTIGGWAADARAVIAAVTPGPLLLVGSSMGGWIALLLARGPGLEVVGPGLQVVGLVGIAAAPDFTETLLWDRLEAAERAALLRDGVLERPSLYGAEPYRFTLRLIEDGRRHRLLDRPIPIACPARLLQGQRDPDVPWPTALTIAERLAGDDVRVHLVKDGDHRLSRPQDLALLSRTVAALLD